MIWTKEQIEEADFYGFTIWVKDDKTWCGDYCEICGQEFIKEVLPNNNNGYIIPRYCNDCVEKHSIENENYK
jgi:hypothetical protein